MEVYDSNIWIYGLTRTCDPAVDLIDEVVENPVHVALNAYIFDEVMTNLDRSEQDREVVEQAKQRFATIVYGNHTIHGPTQGEIEQMDLEAHRTDPRVQMMGDVLGIQPKDVPIVTLAHQYAQRPDTPTITIHTADRPFSDYDPSENFDGIVMRYVDCVN